MHSSTCPNCITPRQPETVLAGNKLGLRILKVTFCSRLLTQGHAVSPTTSIGRDTVFPVAFFYALLLVNLMTTFDNFKSRFCKVFLLQV